ncbi:hypothetical protein ACFP3Q_11400 [Nocardioides sp. GCM10027113]|uniref:hypothetical protein n=1 Tax=unclassified Nocardioides TaxID=2615069 RepID=UPI003623E6CB
MTNDWRPLFTRDSNERSDFDVLHEGVPTWLEGSLWRWLMDRAAVGGPEIIGRLERRLRTPLTTDRDRPLGQQHATPQKVLDRYWKGGDDNSRLTLLDALLADSQEQGAIALSADDQVTVRHHVEAARTLDRLLTDGGSAWRVDQSADGWLLIRRVGEATTELVEAATAPQTDAARKIKSAWSYCYRREPNYDLAYRDAVLAVESLVIPMTVPDSPRASLGTALAHVRETVSRWSVGGLDSKEIASCQTLLDMLKTLWHGQQRHAERDGTIRDVSRIEAEAAVSLSVILVHWFGSGLVKKGQQHGDSERGAEGNPGDSTT